MPTPPAKRHGHGSLSLGVSPLRTDRGRHSKGAAPKSIREHSPVGRAAATAACARIAGCVVDGSVRDLEEISGSGVRLWAAASTPRSDNLRAEAVAINRADRPRRTSSPAK